MKCGRSGRLIPYFLIIWKAAAENPVTRSGPASLLFSKEKWPQKWHIKGVIELRAEELLSMMGSERGANAEYWKACSHEQKIGTAQV